MPVVKIQVCTLNTVYFAQEKQAASNAVKKIRCRVAIVGTIQYYDTKYGKNIIFKKRRERNQKCYILLAERRSGQANVSEDWKLGNGNMSNNITMLYTTYTCKIRRLVWCNVQYKCFFVLYCYE